jgi:hypothetical protein
MVRTYNLKQYIPPYSNRKEEIEFSRVVPVGDIVYLWLTAEKSNVSYIVSTDLRHIQKQYITFHPKLAFGIGTLLVGIEYIYNNINCFCITNIYTYKGESVHSLDWNDKYKMIHKLLKKEYKTTPHSPFLGLPYTIDGYTSFIKAPLTYKGRIEYLGKSSIQKRENTLWKTIMASPKEDIYYIKGTTENVMVNTLKLSVALNRIFRNVKENDNLDAVEESDDEYDNPEETRWIRPVEYNIQCVWNMKYKMYEIVYPLNIRK